MVLSAGHESRVVQQPRASGEREELVATGYQKTAKVFQ